MMCKLWIATLLVGVALGCTNLLVSPGASADASSMISYAADSHVLFGALYHWAHATHPKGEMIDVYDWDSGHYLGKIPQVAETYNVVGNTNEYGLAIGETTYGGLEILQQQKGAIIDYGSAIYLALQRSKTAREAIGVMTELMATYGYASEGESFSLADKNEVWVLEVIGKGNFEKGAVWVAVRVPDGHITAHANQARIRQFPRNDPDNCMYSSDVVSFARAHGLYSGSDEQFSFSDVYAPVTVGNARGCEMRVWAFFREFGHSEARMDDYTDYVGGWNLTHRMPWSIRPARKLVPRDIMHGMRNHLEGTRFEFDIDVGSGPFNAPYRWRPMTWKTNGKTYLNERSTSTQQTGFVFVAQLRPNMPYPLTGVNWFGVDDASCAVFAPFYSSITSPPSGYAVGNGDMMTVKLDSAFWVFNLACNLAYTRWNLIHPEIVAKQDSYEIGYLDAVAKADSYALTLVKSGRVTEAQNFLTNFSTSLGNKLVSEWRDFWLLLTAKYLDGNVKYAVPGEQNPHVEWPGYGDNWYGKIVRETGDRYLMPDGPSKDSLDSTFSPSVSRKL